MDAKQGRRVKVAPGLTAFEYIDFTKQTSRSYDIEGRLVLDDPPSRYILDSFTVRRRREWLPEDSGPGSVADDAEPVTSQGMRTIAVEREVWLVLVFYGLETSGDELDDEQVAELRKAGLEDEAALRFVASIYLGASLLGDPPADEVAYRLDCSPATAARWIAAAKDAGHLRVADPRRR